jgi:hypothetical protein
VSEAVALLRWRFTCTFRCRRNMWAQERLAAAWTNRKKVSTSMKNNPHNSIMAPPALFKNFGKSATDLFKDDDWSATHKLEISNKNAQQTLNASVDGAGKTE